MARLKKSRQPTLGLNEPPMDKIYRDSADITIAFASAKKRNAVADIAAKTLEELELIRRRSVRAAGDSDMPDAVSPGNKRSLIKRILRRIASGVYRALRPVTRPVAFHLRSFLMTGQIQLMQDLHQETLHKFTAMEQALLAEISAIRLKLQREMESNRDEIRNALIIEMRYTRELVQQAAAEWSAPRQAGMEQEAQRLSRIETYAAASARRNAVQCGDDEILVRTVVGYMLCPAHDHALLAQLLDAGEVEVGTRLLIERLLAPNSMYIDVGANIGMHVIAAARAMQGVGSIVCFEPYAPTARLLKKSIFLNGYANLVKVQQAAVFSRTGSQPLFLGQTSGHHSLFSLDEWAASENPPVETRVVRLDDALAPDAHVDLIKIDAEGAELDVLAGASALLLHNPEVGLIVECGAAHLNRSGRDLGDWLTHFESLGFEWKVIDPADGRLVASAPEKLMNTPSVNLFMARSGTRLWMLAEHKHE